MHQLLLPEGRPKFISFLSELMKILYFVNCQCCSLVCRMHFFGLKKEDPASPQFSTHAINSISEMKWLKETLIE